MTTFEREGEPRRSGVLRNTRGSWTKARAPAEGRQRHEAPLTPFPR
jgi:hypothetical protein